MTEKEMRRLSRRDLLELLVDQMRENERLKQLVADQQARLESRRIEIETAGSLAEAAVRLSGVFQAAQSAADQYLENIRCMEQEARARCAGQEAGCP